MINDLTNSSIPLGDSLLKAKVIAIQLENKELIDWINNELNGYGAKELPIYRRLKANSLFTISNGMVIENNFTLPTTLIDKEYQQFLNTSFVTNSISAIEEHLKNTDEGSMHYLPHPPEFLSYANGILIKNGYLTNGYSIIKGSLLVVVKEYASILTSVRNEIIDFLTNIYVKYGDIDIMDSIIHDKKEEINSMGTTNITNYGGVVNTGNKAEVSATISININNKENLTRHLKESNLEQEDIQELLTVIDNDNYNTETNELGDKTSVWMKKMLSKAIDGSWQVSIAAAGNILSQAIFTYYGWPTN